MTPRTVIDTNIWIRILLRGRTTLPVLEAFNAGQFQLVMSQPLFDEFHDVWNRPRLKQRIDRTQAERLERQLRHRSIWVEVKTITSGTGCVGRQARVNATYQQAPGTSDEVSMIQNSHRSILPAAVPRLRGYRS